jgi:hypothetical protein
MMGNAGIVELFLVKRDDDYLLCLLGFFLWLSERVSGI